MNRAHDLVLALITISITSAGCGAVSHETKLIETYVPPPRALIEVGQVTNSTGQVPKVDDKVVDIERMLADALAERLQKEDFLWSQGAGPKLVLNSQITEYDPGDAFKRWLMPGWGSTVVAVECDLRDGDQVVGTLRARRTVSFGGAYTIGAWKTVFGSIAEDVVKELRTKIPKP